MASGLLRLLIMSAAERVTRGMNLALMFLAAVVIAWRGSTFVEGPDSINLLVPMMCLVFSILLILTGLLFAFSGDTETGQTSF